MAEKKTENKKTEMKSLVGTRGRTFKGTVTKKFAKRVVIELERTVFVQKYERFYSKRTRIHARIAEGMDVNIGDTVLAQECRPLSKIIHHVVIKKITGDKK